MRFDQFDCADGRRIGFDHVPLEAGRLWGFRDITQFKLQDEEQAEFLATMSHEIKTPLSGIAGAAELLISAGLPERERDLAEVIADAAQALGGLVRDTLDVTRAEAGRAEGESEDYDPRRLLTSIAGVLRPSLRGRPLELLVEVDPEVPDALHGDAARVRQIVLNLASNAVKYTETGHARIAARAEDERLYITVSDTGKGIAGEDLGRLFEPWTRNHTKAWAGTGLGLSIARRLARAMGGDVTVVSELGAGSAFTLELPLREGERKVKAPPKSVPSLSASRVLVAEDDAALRRLIGMQLERLGATPTLVGDGQAAVDAAAQTAFDAILLDLRMPVLGGLDAAMLIRAADPEIPILALTADTAAGDVEALPGGGHERAPGQARLAALAARGARPPDPADPRRRPAGRARRQPRRARAREPDARRLPRLPARAAPQPARRRHARGAARRGARAALSRCRLRHRAAGVPPGIGRSRRARGLPHRARPGARRRRAHRSRAGRTLERFLTSGRARLESPRRSKGHEVAQA